MAMLRYGIGWGIVPKHMIQHELQHSQFKELLLTAYPATEWQVGVDLVWSTRENLGIAGMWLRQYVRTRFSDSLINTERGRNASV